MKLELRPIPISRAQRRFRESRAWLRGFVGGRGAGKTKIGSIDLLQRAKPGEPWMVISPDNNMIRETTLPTFIESAKFSGQYIDHVCSPTPRLWFHTRPDAKGKYGKAEVVFKGAEVPDKLRGPNKAGLWFDEASIIHKDAFDIAIACCRFRGRMGPVLATFTPRGFKHWTFESFYDPVDEVMIGSDGCSADGLEWFRGKPYRPRHNSFLVRCSTRDNPFAPKEYAATIANNYSSTLALQELEGDFIEMSGLIFKREWFGQTVMAAPADATRVRYWDKAATADGGCYTVGLLMARDAFGVYYVEDVVRGQWSANQRNQIMLQTARRDAFRYGGSVLTYIEQEGAGDGKTVVDQLIVMLSEFPVYRDVVGGSRWKTKGNVRLPGDAKQRRAQPYSAQAEAGNVRLVVAPWNGDYCDELALFPEYAYADQVDASSGAFNVLQRVAPQFGDLTASRIVEAAGVSRFGQTIGSTGHEVATWEQLPWNQPGYEDLRD
jgi:predicted phage terminase large subunit-like protein